MAYLSALLAMMISYFCGESTNTSIFIFAVIGLAVIQKTRDCQEKGDLETLEFLVKLQKAVRRENKTDWQRGHSRSRGAW